jgi:D-alanyl-D-alanine carboxypeptidase
MQTSKLWIARALMASAALALGTSFVAPASALDIPPSFVKLADSQTLNHPGIIVIDPATGETVYSAGSDTLRAPASVLKLISTTTALKTFGADKKFTTTINATAHPSVFVMTGESDPWLTGSQFEAKKYHRAYSPSLINAAIAGHSHLRSITLYYKDVYAADVAVLQHFFKGRLRITAHALPSAASAQALITKPIATISSPPLREIIDFTLLWSDNVLADRLAHSAAHQMGLPGNIAGIQGAFEKTLTALNVPSEGLAVQDGNGLSHQTRVSARTIATLLLNIKKDPELKVIYDGLPTAGETGTLKSRFVKDAPSAVGLVRAKTGWIDTTVSLAGYVTSGEKQYIFAVIADRITNRESARGAARVTIDKMLSTIARPAPARSPSESAPTP